MSVLKPIKLIIGLGNHPLKYRNTRHNAGYWWLNALWQQENVSKIGQQFDGNYAIVNLNKYVIHTLQPTTYMNDSGVAVQKIMHFYKITAQEILVVHDELDLLPGKIRLKFSGGHAGHNGLKSIIQHIHTVDFLRLRIGIGHPGREQVLQHVLSSPENEEYKLIISAIQFSLSHLSGIIAGNWHDLFGIFNSFTAT